MANQIVTPDFKLSGVFRGKPGESASRWLKKYEWDWKSVSKSGDISPEDFFSGIEILFDDDAADWIESTPAVSELIQYPSDKNVQLFKSMFISQYSVKNGERSTSFHHEISNLRQGESEGLHGYYRRALLLLQQIGIQDASSEALSRVESLMLDNVIDHWIQGLAEPEIRRETLRSMAGSNGGLAGVYNIAVHVQKNLHLIKRYEEEERRDKELDFYRQIARSKFSAESLEAAYASHGIKDKASSPPAFPLSKLEPLKDTVTPPNRGFYGDPSRNPRPFRDIKSSSNPFVNGSRTYSYHVDGPLCLGCGQLGNHGGPRNCENEPLSGWERAIIRKLIYPEGPTNTNIDSKPPQDEPTVVAPAANSYAISYGTPIDNRLVRYPQVLLGDGSAPNKRGEQDQPGDPSQNIRTQAGRPDRVRRLDQGNPVPNPPGPDRTAGISSWNPTALNSPNPSNPYMANPFMNPSQSTTQPQPQPQREPAKKASRKKDRTKAADVIPIQGLFNIDAGIWGKPIAIRELMKDWKVELSLMDLCAISPHMCQELKRLTTRPRAKRPRVSKNQKDPPQQFPFTVAPSSLPNPSFPVYQSQPPVSSGAIDVSSAEAAAIPPSEDYHTRFLSSLVGVEKSFRIPAVLEVNGEKVILEKRVVQADQGSDMNIIHPKLVQRLGLEINPLEAVGFKGLCMTTADHKDTPLTGWTIVNVGVEDIWRTIRCFVGPDSHNPQVELLLGLPWLYSVDAHISIRDSKITVGDRSLGENPRDVIGPELIYSPAHYLLVYPKPMAAHQPFHHEHFPDSDTEESLSEDWSDDPGGIHDPKEIDSDDADF